jgi:hypothetical protein
LIEAPTLGFEGAQISDAGREHEGKLLRLARARLMRDAPVYARGPSRDALLGDQPRRAREALGKLLPAHRHAAATRHVGDGIKAEVDAELCCFIAAPRHKLEQVLRDGATVEGRGLEAQPDVVELDAAKRLVERLDRPGIHAETPRGGGAGKHQCHLGGAARKIRKRKARGFVRVGMIDPLDKAPWPSRGQGSGMRFLRGGVKRLDRQAIGAMRDERLDALALQRLRDELAPAMQIAIVRDVVLALYGRHRSGPVPRRHHRRAASARDDGSSPGIAALI